MSARTRRRGGWSRLLSLSIASLFAVTAAACGDDAAAPATTAPVTDPADEWDESRINDAREAARGLLGMNEDDLDADVRIARRGEEEFALTMDFVLGRRTVELDDTDASGYRVVSVTVELPEGAEEFELEAG